MANRTDKNRERLLRKFTDYLKSAGLRCTPERYIVLECIEKIDGAFSAADVALRLSEGNERVTVSTVYASLGLLCDCGIIRRLAASIGKGAVYERTDNGRIRLVCLDCGSTRSMSDAFLDQYIPGTRFAAFKASDYTVTVNGLCSACSKRRRRLTRSKANSKKSSSKTSL